jgi:hypothetical protein
VPPGDLSGIKEKKMKLLRLTLVCSLLLLAASPSYAIACFSCTAPDPPYCESTPDSGTRCRFGIDTCETISAPSCTGFTEHSAPAMLAEWTVASIDIRRPTEGTKVVTTPAAVAEVGVSQSALQK